MKRLLKLAISLLVYGWDLLTDALRRFASRPAPPRCVVIYYHAVPASCRELFARQMDFILRRAKPVPSDPSQTFQPGQRYVCVTFDDGFLSVKENAAPELARRQIPWTIFVPSGHLGAKPQWLRQAHPAARQDRVMSAEELRELSREPLVTVGSHTVVHAHLLEIGSERASVELHQSRLDLERALGKPVDQFSYPFGARSPALDEEARRAGYRRIFSSDPEFVFRSPAQFLCGRISVDPDISALEFRLKVLGAYRWQSWLRRSEP